MDPEVVREVLQIINEVSQPVYAAAYQKVVATNVVALMALFPALAASIWFTLHAHKEAKADKSPFGSDWWLGITFGALAAIGIYAAIVCVIGNLLTADYRTYQAIRMLLW